jgi:hypothetical protein
MSSRREFLQQVLAACAAPCLPTRPAVAGQRHAAVHLYTRPRLLPRHAAIVQQALVRRAAAHTSAFQLERGKPLLAIGPVNQNVWFWKKDGSQGKQIERAWPLVAVVEYDGDGGPEVYLDWFRRARHASTDDGWLLDPGVGYAEHINAETVTGLDDRLCYLAVPDTPTGSYLGDSEFVVRARLRWQDGETVALGWWFWFEAPKAKTTDDWYVEQIPLADWRVTKSTRKLGACDTGPLADPARQLAVWGTEQVFTFPTMPTGLVSGRGRS